jgi:nitrous oxide reductase
MVKATINEPTEVNLARRNFLCSVKYVTAISVVALAGKSPVSKAATRVVAPAGQAASGYRETGHIRKYYESARY